MTQSELSTPLPPELDSLLRSEYADWYDDLVLFSKLNVTQSMFIKYGDTLLNHTIEPADKSSLLTTFLMLAAQEQIETETIPTSPWYVEESETDKDKLAQKEGLMQSEIAQRALSMSFNLTYTAELAQLDIASIIHKQRLETFPVDGTYMDLGARIKNAIPEREGTDTTMMATFVKQTLDLFEAADIEPITVARVIQKRGMSALPRLVNASNRLRSEAKGPDDLVDDLRTMVETAHNKSIAAFEEEYQRHGVPPIVYSQHRGSDQNIIVLVATDDQAEMFKGRMRGKLRQAENDLLAVITPERVLEAAETGDLSKLLRAAIMSDPVRTDVLLFLEKHAGELNDLPYIASVMSYKHGLIVRALTELVRYGAVTKATIGNKEMWSVPQ